ncbi:MAG: DUF885 domain-containing protein, partial [Lachnospiraceae bacterium]|nr:DUF885 domain-containing protein [Lachnospiraceae bacterium]
KDTLDCLARISPSRLSENDAYTYDLLVRYLTLRLSGASYDYYSEPLSPSSGMQSGLPILLADYTFRSAEDVEDYLHILDQTDTYFEGLIRYEKEKADAGLFMSDDAAGKIIEQCGSIMDKELLDNGSHFLHTTFEERLTAMETDGLITQQQKDQWISENDRLLTTVLYPAYESVADAFTTLQGRGANSMGLCHFPDGRAYYEYLLASTTGSSRSISEIKNMFWQDFQQNFSDLAALLQSNPELAAIPLNTSSNFPYSSPKEMLTDLQNQMASDFPVFPEAENDFAPSCTVKKVSSSMENYCSPAYYLTPPIDDMRTNIIYINHKNKPDALTLYTTLAHEGYPGHLYQTVYSQLHMNNEQVSGIRYLLHYGGYVEGWALYAENMSYCYAQKLIQDTNPAEALWYEACRLNRNLQLCLYSLLDVAIHYEGATPAQVQKILQKMGITSRESAVAIYQYIVEEPANYPKYYLGFLEFCALKDRAQEVWGEEFSLLRFHRFVLETGPSDFQGLNSRLAASAG